MIDVTPQSEEFVSHDLPGQNPDEPTWSTSKAEPQLVLTLTMRLGYHILSPASYPIISGNGNTIGTEIIWTLIKKNKKQKGRNKNKNKNTKASWSWTPEQLPASHPQSLLNNAPNQEKQSENYENSVKLIKKTEGL